MSDPKSNLPEGDFTWSTGSNYGLDGFGHDTNYGDAQDSLHILQNNSQGVTNLPDGVVTGDPKVGVNIEAPLQIQRIEDGFDLTSMLSETEIYGDQNLEGYFDPLAYARQATAVALGGMAPPNIVEATLRAISQTPDHRMPNSSSGTTRTVQRAQSAKRNPMGLAVSGASASTRNIRAMIFA